MGTKEKELRLKIDSIGIENIKDNTILYKTKNRLIDITCGKYGFDSLKKLGYICRIRCENLDSKLEIKKYFNNEECIEKSIKIENIKDAIEFLSLMNMLPYLVLDRYREVRKYNDLLIYIDEFDSIGSYIEIEYQDSSYEEAINFARKFNLDITPQGKYGDIIKEKLENSIDFRKEFEYKLKKTLNSEI